MDKVHKVFWSQTALDELAGILAYPPEVKERIYLEELTGHVRKKTLEYRGECYEPFKRSS